MVHGKIRATFYRKSLIVGLALVALPGCSSLFKDMFVPDVEILPPDDAGTDAGGTLPESGFDTTTLMVVGVEPGYGPYSGNQWVVVRGNGFISGSSVLVGDNLISADSTQLEDSHRLKILMPPGDPGPVDITVKRGAEQVTLTDGYVYNDLVVEPESGSQSGGLLVNILGKSTRFTQGVAITFGGEPCSDVSVLSETHITCKTPPNRAGGVDVVVSSAGSVDPPIVGRKAFTYLDPGEVSADGLAGGPISGAVQITVVDNSMGILLPGVFVMLGDDLGTPYQGFTNQKGEVTFSAPELKGPVSIHAALKCYEKGSIIGVDAAHVTLFLRSVIGADPACKLIPDDPTSQEYKMKQQNGGNSGHGRAVSYIRGEVMLSARDEFYANDWNRIPVPRGGEVRVIYVFVTNSSTTSGTIESGDITDRRIEEGEATLGTRGYPYQLISRPAGLALYALGGIENETTGEFTPYLMGLVPDLVPQPGEDLTGVDIEIDIPLDNKFSVALEQLPGGTPTGPDRFSVQSYLDLGGVGLIRRQVNRYSLDTIERSIGSELFTFYAQPALAGSLANASYKISAGWYTGDDQDPPYTYMVLSDIRPTEAPTVVNGWLGIPQAVSPSYSAMLPKDRRLRWSADGARPDLQVVTLIGGDGIAAWRQIVPGSVNETSIPDLSTVPEVGLQDIASGHIKWAVRAVKIVGFHFNEFQYTVLSQQNWTHEAYNTFLMRR
jgi:hypothetical protein